MSGIATAIVGSAIVGGVVANSAANKQADAANNASASSTAASQAALTENQRQYDQNRLDQQPYMQRGNAAGNRLQELMGLGGNAGSAGYGTLGQSFTGANLASEPGYQFGLQQGQQGLDNGASARGGYYSGAQLKAASRYNNDYASTKYTDAYNRYNNDQTTQFNRLSGISGTGQQATNNIGAQGANMAATNGNIMTQNAYNNGQNTMGAANARASGYMAGGNALQNALNQGISMYGRNNAGGFAGYNSGVSQSTGLSTNELMGAF